MLYLTPKDMALWRETIVAAWIQRYLLLVSSNSDCQAVSSVTTCSSKGDWQQWGEKLEETDVCVCTMYLFLIFKILVLPKSKLWNVRGYLQVSIMLFKPACKLWQLNILSWNSKCSIGIWTKIKSWNSGLTVKTNNPCSSQCGYMEFTDTDKLLSHVAHLLKFRHVWRCFQDWGYIIEWLENSPLWVSIKHGSSSTNQCTGMVIWSWDHVYSTRHGWHQRVNLGCEHSVLAESLRLPAVITVQLFSCQCNIFLLGGGQGKRGREEWVHQDLMPLWYGWWS